MGLAITDLDDLISTVLTKGRQSEREVRGEDGKWYSLRIRPYRTANGKIHGALLALLDIHALKENRETACKQERFVSAVLDAAGWTLLVMVLDPEGRIVHFNRACQVLSGYSLEEVRGRGPGTSCCLSRSLADSRPCSSV
jgi:two-component system CheB/CheR fusion protein